MSIVNSYVNVYQMVPMCDLSLSHCTTVHRANTTSSIAVSQYAPRMNGVFVNPDYMPIIPIRECMVFPLYPVILAG